MTFVTGGELAPATYPHLYDALVALRPSLLRSHRGRLVVEIDGARVEGFDVLRTIRTADVLTVERTNGLRNRDGQPSLLVRLR